MLIEHSTLYKRYFKENLRLIYVIEFHKLKIVGFSFMDFDYYYKELYYSIDCRNIKRYIPVSFTLKLTDTLELQECYLNSHYCGMEYAADYDCVNPGKLDAVFLRDLNFKPVIYEDYCTINLEGTVIISESMLVNIHDDYFALFCNKPE